MLQALAQCAIARAFMESLYPSVAEAVLVEAAVIGRVIGGSLVRLKLAGGFFYCSVFVGECGCTRLPHDNELELFADLPARRLRWVPVEYDPAVVLRCPS